MGGDYRAEDQGTHVRQSDDRRVCLGPASRCSCVSFNHYIFSDCISFIVGGQIENYNKILMQYCWFLSLSADDSYTGSGQLTASGGSFSTTRHRDFITTTPRRSVPCGTGQTTATSSLWPNYRYVPAYSTIGNGISHVSPHSPKHFLSTSTKETDTQTAVSLVAIRLIFSTC